MSKDIYFTGDYVPSGNYVCNNCCTNDDQNIIMFEENGNQLPVCPSCGETTTWTKF